MKEFILLKQIVKEYYTPFPAEANFTLVLFWILYLSWSISTEYKYISSFYSCSSQSYYIPFSSFYHIRSLNCSGIFYLWSPLQPLFIPYPPITILTPSLQIQSNLTIVGEFKWELAVYIFQVGNSENRHFYSWFFYIL